MKKTAWPLTVLLVLLAFPQVAAANPLRTSLIPSGARWVIHIDVARLAETRVKGLLYEGSPGGVGRVVKRMETVGKIDLLRDLTGVTIIGLGEREQDTVVVFEGKFDREYLLSLIKLETSAKEIPYRKFTLYNWGSTDYGVFASDNLTLLGGSARTIQMVLDAWEGKDNAAPNAPIIAKLSTLSSGAFVVASAGKLSALAKDERGSFFLKKAGAAVLRVVEEKGVVKLNLELETDSPETASNLAKLADGLIALQAMGGETPSRDLEFLKGLKIVQQGSTLLATLETAAENFFRKWSPLF